jgi:hypothetical protein
MLTPGKLYTISAIEESAYYGSGSILFGPRVRGTSFFSYPLLNLSGSELIPNHERGYLYDIPKDDVIMFIELMDVNKIIHYQPIFYQITACCKILHKGIVGYVIDTKTDVGKIINAFRTVNI